MPAVTDLAAYLSVDRVVALPAGLDQRAVLRRLAEACTQGSDLILRETFARALLDRETVGSTAVGGGAAIPHARLADWPCCRLALGLCPSGVSFAASDGRPVRLLVCMAARESDHHEHLRLLAALATRLRRPGFVEAVLVAPSPAEALAAFL
jgi:mannitol/fructose-specific phosphotransferase system IIA component (Ntr-type)